MYKKLLLITCDMTYVVLGYCQQTLLSKKSEMPSEAIVKQ